MTPDAADVLMTLEDFLARPAWHQRASCKSVGVRTYFANDEGTLELARAVCASCEIRQECYDTAMADKDLEGVWAGFTAKVRRGIRRGSAVA